MMQARGMDYDRAAGRYAAHRRIHSGVFQELCRTGRLGTGSIALEVGCGTGNYVEALRKRFRCSAYGLDPSAAMLVHARTTSNRVGWVLGRGEQLGFADNTFDLVLSVDVIHHVSDKAGFFCEMARSLRSGGRLCTVTDSEETIRRREVLSGYFPETVQSELERYPPLAQLEAWSAAAGLEPLDTVVAQEPYEITSSQPFRDKAYSALHNISENAWRAGLVRLERDLKDGPVQGSSRSVCVWSRKSE